MKPAAFRGLAATACAAILMVAAAHAWKTLRAPQTGPRSAVETEAPGTKAPAPEPDRGRPAGPRDRVDRADRVEHVADRPAVSEPARSGVDAIRTSDRLVNVTARCDAAEEAYRKIRDDSAQLGQIPHPGITQAWSRMRLALEGARKELDRGEEEQARSSLDVAEASAAKVIRSAGGN
jgi:hypothetical protein